MNDNENDGLSRESREQINGTTIWIQIAAYTSFISAGLGVLSMIRGQQFGGIVGIAISVYLGVQLLEQGKFMTQFGQSNEVRDYEQSLKAEGNYWTTMKILMFIAVAFVALLIIGLLLFPEEMIMLIMENILLGDFN
jgi:hypothetical protein